MTTEREKMIAALIDASEQAAQTAREYKRMAQNYPKYAEHDMAEAMYALWRSREYMERIELWRAEQ